MSRRSKKPYKITDSLVDEIQPYLPYSKEKVRNKGGFTLSKKRHKLIKLDEVRTDINRVRQKDIVIIPRNRAQEEYVDKLFDHTNRIVFAIGPAGTGKTMIAVKRALKALLTRQVDRIIVTRPAVSVGEKHGYLPGDLVEKMDPWVRPIFDVFEEHFSPIEIKKMIEEKVIEIVPLAFMRGRTFKNAYIIADETQNCTVEQMKMLLTRIGENSYMAVTGDLRQHDRGYDRNGLKDFIERFFYQPKTGITTCTFEKKDIERDEIVGKILDIYGDEE